MDSLTAKLQASETELQALKEKAARLEAQLSSRPDSLAPAKAEVEAISTGTPEAPSPVRPSKHAGCAKYFVEAAEKVFAARNALVEQLCDCEAGLRLNTVSDLRTGFRKVREKWNDEMFNEPSASWANWFQFVTGIYSKKENEDKKCATYLLVLVFYCRISALRNFMLLNQC